MYKQTPKISIEDVDKIIRLAELAIKAVDMELLQKEITHTIHKINNPIIVYETKEEETCNNQN